MYLQVLQDEDSADPAMEQSSAAPSVHPEASISSAHLSAEVSVLVRENARSC